MRAQKKVVTIFEVGHHEDAFEEQWHKMKPGLVGQSCIGLELSPKHIKVIREWKKMQAAGRKIELNPQLMFWVRLMRELERTGTPYRLLESSRHTLEAETHPDKERADEAKWPKREKNIARRTEDKNIPVIVVGANHSEGLRNILTKRGFVVRRRQVLPTSDLEFEEHIQNQIREEQPAARIARINYLRRRRKEGKYPFDKRRPKRR